MLGVVLIARHVADEQANLSNPFPCTILLELYLLRTNKTKYGQGKRAIATCDLEAQVIVAHVQHIGSFNLPHSHAPELPSSSARQRMHIPLYV